MTVTCFHCAGPLDECRRSMLREATGKAVREIGFAELATVSGDDQEARVAVWDAARAVKDLVDLIIAQDYGTSVEDAHEQARALIEEMAATWHQA
ncbi:hypothetical protein ACFV0L_18860 [Streptosporangium canum]|uniref:hypothetical protein n=1 Tax=Streptosporangium canum TaxID=324952 RepID=UPI0036AEA885